ncbi:MAG: AsmA family protein, partial [Halieaceae bacterium]|nr:AsmA family protein [Halieaceae bacterium]
MNRAIRKRIAPPWLLRIAMIGSSVIVVITLAGAATLAVLVNNPEKMKVVLEGAGSRILDRDLQIGEILEVNLDRDIYLQVRDIRLGNPSWADTPDFFRAGHLKVRINLLSIWRDGPIRIDTLNVSDARLALLAPSEHLPNWIFFAADTEQAEGEGESEGLFPLLIRKGNINNSEILYRDSARKVAVNIASMVIRERGEGVPSELGLTGTVNEIPLSATGHIESLAALLTRRDLNFDLAVNWGQLSVEGRGSINDLVNLSGPDLHLEVSAPSSQPLLNLLGVPLTRDGPLYFEGDVTDAQPGLVVNIAGAMSEFNVRLSGKLTRPLELDGVDMAYQLSGPSLAEMGAMFNLVDLPERPYEMSGEIYREGRTVELSNGLFTMGKGRLAIAGRLPNFPQIDDWEAIVEGTHLNLGLFGPLLGVEGIPVIPYAITGELGSTDEGVELVNLQIQGPGTRLGLSGIVGEAPDYVGSRMELELSGENLAYAGKWLGISELPELAFHATGELALGEPGWQLRNGVFETSGLQLGLNAEFDTLPEPGSLNARVNFTSADLGQTLKLYGLELEGLPPFPTVLDGTVRGSLDRLEVVEATVE